MKTEYLMENPTPEEDKLPEAATMKPYAPPSYKDGRAYGIPPERIAAALTEFSALSPRVQVTQPTPELALVEMSKHVIDQSRMLTEALTTAKYNHDQAERLAALETACSGLPAIEATLAGLAVKIDSLRAPAIKSTATKAPPATPKTGEASSEDDLEASSEEGLTEPMDSVDDYVEIIEPEKPAPKMSRSGKARTRRWI